MKFKINMCLIVLGFTEQNIYSERGHMVKLSTRAAITMYTDKIKLSGNLFQLGDRFLTGNMYLPNDMFSLVKS